MKLKSLRKDIAEYLVVHKLDKKWDKAIHYFNKDIHLII